eukprot:c44287_g1_i1 orf=2-259(-)
MSLALTASIALLQGCALCMITHDLDQSKPLSLTISYHDGLGPAPHLAEPDSVTFFHTLPCTLILCSSPQVLPSGTRSLSGWRGSVR